METINLKTGHVLQFSTPSFADSMNLSKVLARELKSVDVDLGNLANLTDVENMDVMSLLAPLLQLYASDAAHMAVMKCLDKSLVEGRRINTSLFEEEEFRPDYLELCVFAVKRAVSPLFASLDFKSSKKPAAPSTNQA